MIWKTVYRILFVAWIIVVVIQNAGCGRVAIFTDEHGHRWYLIVPTVPEKPNNPPGGDRDDPKPIVDPAEYE